MAAVGTNIGPALGKLMQGRADDSAFLAVKARATETHLHDVLRAGARVGEALEELAGRELRAGGRALLRHGAWDSIHFTHASWG